nr:PREDICTED: uncharacterized protein LOC109031173 [Bemisia tabaci]XP_018898082.1 PREDICTED: uncharacterized protein LOC109031173 [Bemisia tabaci]
MTTFREIYWLFGVVLIVSLAGRSCQDDVSENAVGGPVRGQMPPLAVISDAPMSLAKSMARVPLLPVPQKDLVVMRNTEITALSPDNALVQCYNQRTGLTEAMPAVKMLLRTPVFINSGLERTVVDFPSVVNVFYRGSMVPLPVGALIAPITYQQLSQPILIKTVYAVPTFPLNYHYAPSLAATTYSRPPYLFQPYPLGYNLYSQYGAPAPYYPYRPMGALPAPAPAPVVPSSDAKPQPQPPAMAAVQPATVKQPPSVAYATKPGAPVVTVLDFPEAVASPSVLYYQPPISSDSEFENREPPQPVIPAGIVQSTQPQANQQLFLNSKESVYLLSIKEDVKRA